MLRGLQAVDRHLGVVGHPNRQHAAVSAEVPLVFGSTAGSTGAGAAGVGLGRHGRRLDAGFWAGVGACVGVGRRAVGTVAARRATSRMSSSRSYRNRSRVATAANNQPPYHL